MSTEDLPDMKKKRKKRSISNPRSSDAGLYSPPPLPRWLSSLPSTVSSFGEESDMDICRICHGEGDQESLVAPCYCAGTLRYVHQSCLQQWIKSSNIRCCELCNFQFIMHTKTKPFRKWEQLEMSPVERRKLLCSLAFHMVALMCVVWSIYVLIERTVEEVRAGALEWTFWTKIVVLAIGFTGGFVFMYVQCRVYAQIFLRWRSLNRVIYLEDAPEKERKTQQLPQSPQQPASDDSSLDQPATGDVQVNEDKCTSPDEDQFHSCMSESSTSCSGGSSKNVSAHSSNDKDLNDETPVAAGAGSSKTTLTSVGDNLAPTSDQHSLTEVVVVTNVSSPTQQESVSLKEIQIKGSSSS